MSHFSQPTFLDFTQASIEYRPDKCTGHCQNVSWAACLDCEASYMGFAWCHIRIVGSRVLAQLLTRGLCWRKTGGYRYSNFLWPFSSRLVASRIGWSYSSSPRVSTPNHAPSPLRQWELEWEWRRVYQVFGQEGPEHCETNGATQQPSFRHFIEYNYVPVVPYLQWCFGQSPCRDARRSKDRSGQGSKCLPHHGSVRVDPSRVPIRG